MSKKLFIAAAAALACASVQAQSVSVYGLLDMSIVDGKSPGSNVSITGVASGNMTTSFWGMKATEKLSGGLSAEATLEGFVRLTNGALGRFDGDPLFSRNANIAVKGGFGTLALGRITNGLFVNNLIFNALSDSFGFSPSIRLLHLSAGQASGDTGWNESIKWTSPSFSGASVSVHHALQGNRFGGNTNVSALYFGGPISLGGSWQEVRRRDGAPGSAGASDSNAWQLGAAYDAKTVKVFAQAGKVENKTFNVNYSHMGVGASVPLSADGKVLMQYSSMDPNNAKASKTSSLAYDHFISKRTDLYLVYMDERTPLGSGATFGLGMRHRF